MNQRSVLVSTLIGVSLTASQALATVNFGQILTFDPLTDPVEATFTADVNNTQTWTGQQKKDAFDNPYPEVHWFKYTSDGNSAVTFDTYGTNISSDGPDPYRGPGSFITDGNSTQIAVYDSAGNLVARTGAVKDLNGELIPEFPSALDDPEDPNYYSRASAVQLSELMFMQNAPDNPHWDTSPGGISDPASTTEFEGLYIHCDTCSGQTYGDQPNEYQVWDTALSYGNTNFPRTTNRFQSGPGASWNRYDILPAGDYYVVVTGTPPSFSGDTYKEEWMMAPIHDGYDSNLNFIQDVPLIDAPMGPFEMYRGNENLNFPSAWGDIQLNVTTYALTIPGDLNGDGYVGLDDLQPILDHWNQNVTVGDAAMGDIAGPGGTGPDGYVGLDDLQPVLDHWNEGTLPTPSSIPEPAGLALLGLGGLALLRRRA